MNRRNNMKFRAFLITAALGCALGAAAPAFAQTAQQDLQQYVNSHPELQANPSLMNNPTYRANHPDLNHFLETHPQVDRQRYGSSGAYDRNHEWRNSDWWHHHHNNSYDRDHDDWYARNHPETYSHPGWDRAHPMAAPYGAHPVPAVPPVPRATVDHHNNVAEYGHAGPHHHVW
jgi:hypothetical protein